MTALLSQFTVFAVIASITPGPTNILALTNGQRLGWRATLPFSVGGGGGAALLLLATTLGLTPWMNTVPLFRTALAWGGTLWMSYLAWSLYRSPPLDGHTPSTRRTSAHWTTGLAMQIVNPKTWVMAVTVTSLFPADGIAPVRHAVILAGLFFIVAVPCIGVWGWAGHHAGRLIAVPGHQRRMNQGLAIALGVSTWCALLL